MLIKSVFILKTVAETRAQLADDAHCVDPYPHLWSQAVGSDRKSKQVLCRRWKGDSFARFLCNITLCDWLRILAMWKSLRVKRNQLSWFGYLARMRPGRLLLELYQAQGRPRTSWTHYISKLAWEYLRIPQEELESLTVDRDVWAELHSLLLCHNPKPGKNMNEWMKECC